MRCSLSRDDCTEASEVKTHRKFFCSTDLYLGTNSTEMEQRTRLANLRKKYKKYNFPCKCQ